MDSTQLDPRFRKFGVAAAWCSLAVVAYATLSKVGLVYHLYYKLAPFLDYPSMRSYASFEHVFACMVVGALFCMIYPRSPWRICLLLFLGIACLEALQNLTPDRHGTLRDAVEKMTGAAVGVFLVRLGLLWAQTRRPRAAS